MCKAGGVEMLVQLLAAGPKVEITEFAAALLGSLAAGGHILKDSIREVSYHLLKACRLASNPPGQENKFCRLCAMSQCCGH